MTTIEHAAQGAGAPAQGVGAPADAAGREQLREQIREQVRQSIEQARVDAVRAREDARLTLGDVRAATAQGGPGVPAPPDAPPPPETERVIVTGDGRTIVIRPDGSVDGGGLDVGTTEAPDFGPFGPGGPRVPEEIVVMFIAFMMMIVLVAIGGPIARAYGRRIDRRAASAPELSDVGQRLDRIEQAIETVAVEVERISEGQRYTARLMSEMQAARIPAGEGGR